MTAYMDHKDLANEVIDQARAQEITDGVHRVLDRIASAESAAGRAAGSVQLLAATNHANTSIDSRQNLADIARLGGSQQLDRTGSTPGCGLR